MYKKIIRLGFVLACGPLMMVADMTAADHPAGSTFSVQQPTVAVLRFAVQSPLTANSATLSSKACTDPAAVPDMFTVDPELLDNISNELQIALSKKKMSVLVDPDPYAIPVDSLVISGCIFQAQQGNQAKRMAGLGWGASRLGASVIVFSKKEKGFVPVDAFEVKVKGRFLTPPTAVAAHAARARTETLSADAKKLAARITKKLDNN